MTLRCFLAALFFAIPGTGYGQEKSRAVIFSFGGAGVFYSEPDTYLPMASLTYLKKFGKTQRFGNHWEAAIGFGESYGGVAWQFDAWLLDYLRIGAGLGVFPLFDKLPGNPILVPLPELSIGCNFQRGNLIYSGEITGNLGYGARAIAGVGYAF